MKSTTLAIALLWIALHRSVSVARQQEPIRTGDAGYLAVRYRLLIAVSAERSGACIQVRLRVVPEDGLCTSSGRRYVFERSWIVVAPA